MKRKTNIIVLIILIVFVLSPLSAFSEEADYLTPKERKYAENYPVITVGYLDGVAPFLFDNSKNETAGIIKEILDDVSRSSGLSFSYVKYESITQALSTDSLMSLLIAKEYYIEGLIHTDTVLSADTVLCVRHDVDPLDLSQKKCAIIVTGPLPDDADLNLLCLCASREETFDALENGLADYTYANEYSVFYYSLMYIYKNFYSIPQREDIHNYVLGFKVQDPVLMEILNKSFAQIDDNTKKSIILSTLSNVERILTLGDIMRAYGVQLILMALLFIAVLSALLISIHRKSKSIKFTNTKYESLSSLTNEFLFEYGEKEKKLILSERLKEYLHNVGIDPAGEAVHSIIKEALSNNNENGKVMTLDIGLEPGQDLHFNLVTTYVGDEKSDQHSILGKLTDVTEEVHHKEGLVKLSRTDDLTSILNRRATTELILNRLNNKEASEIDALFVIDIDDFKSVNDTYGHPEGDSVLISVAKIAEKTAEGTGYAGRLGGDEFVIYYENIPSKEAVINKAKHLFEAVLSLKHKRPIKVSIGICFTDNADSYEELFRKADKALYKAKENPNKSVHVAQ
ncbi:MAG: GGDEF domain-containing protein [Anaerovoracaceae bacterium]|nr:GGDEF domain-containing protein [Clostridiales bacterium]